MKLRIYRDSLRLRLRKPQVQQLMASGQVTETTAIAPGVEFQYRLEAGGDRVAARWDARGLAVMVPKAVVARWAQSDQVAIDGEQSAGAGRVLRIMIEKDFACRDGSNEESQEGAYENPVGSSC